SFHLVDAPEWLLAIPPQRQTNPLPGSARERQTIHSDDLPALSANRRCASRRCTEGGGGGASPDRSRRGRLLRGADPASKSAARGVARDPRPQSCRRTRAPRRRDLFLDCGLGDALSASTAGHVAVRRARASSLLHQHHALPHAELVAIIYRAADQGERLRNLA